MVSEQLSARLKTLHEQLAAVCPLEGVRLDKNGEPRAVFASPPTEMQRQAADDLVAGNKVLTDAEVEALSRTLRKTRLLRQLPPELADLLAAVEADPIDLATTRQALRIVFKLLLEGL